MAIAFKPTCGLNAFAFQYVNSQCQHDSLFAKLAAKLHIPAETPKFLTDFSQNNFSYTQCINDRSDVVYNDIPLIQHEAYRAQPILCKNCGLFRVNCAWP